MALVPFSYNTRSLFVRRSATMLTVLGIGATVAVLAGVLALQQGFSRLFSEGGRDDIAVFLRQGSTSEGDSSFTLERAQILMKTVDVFEKNAEGKPLVTAESFLAVRRFKRDGGETNVPVRGTTPIVFDIFGSDVAHGGVKIIEGRMFSPGTDEVIVGRKLVDRVRDCQPGDVITFNVTPFRVVGVFDHDGPFSSEVWGDRDRINSALQRPVMNRVVGRVKPGTEIGFNPPFSPFGGTETSTTVLTGLAAQLDKDPQVPCKVMNERQYLESQTLFLSGVLKVLGYSLAVIMGIAAVFTATNTMLAALAARTKEIGILLALGFRPLAIFTSFMLEAVLLGLLGGAVGCLLVLPINGVKTGTMNWQTFTEVAFAFRVTPQVMLTAVTFSLILGLLGGAWPALRAALMRPTHAMRRE
jgi:putative ABC transport system permease protein